MTQEEVAAAFPALLKNAYQGKIPSYSSLETPSLHMVKTATVGSFVVCYSTDATATGIHGTRHYYSIAATKALQR